MAKIIGEGLTFDDLLLVPQYSEVLPREVDVTTWLSRHIRLNIPILSAPMDTVTEAEMAIIIACLGGIGIIHKNLSPDRQAQEVSKVKRWMSWMIADPYTLGQDNSLKDAKELMEKHNIAGIPIVDDQRKLMGIITKRDLHFETNLDLKIGEVMTREVITAHQGITQKEAEDRLHVNRIEKLPVIDEDKVLRGLITIRDIEKRHRYPEACKDEKDRLRVGATVGVAKDTEERAQALIEAGVDVLIVDTAHGHSKGVFETVKMIRKKFGNVELIAGNVATAEGAKFLIDAGVDAIKVGVGPGSICTARVIAGAGVPQITAIMDVAKKVRIPVIADGGVRFSGDITKALAAGADTVMIGNLLAGCKEGPGEEILLGGRRYKSYRGMGSIAAMEAGSKDRYHQEHQEEAKKLVPEGVEGRVPFKGPGEDVVHQLVGGLRSGMGYCGARNIQELQEKAKFIRITQAGGIESHPHDVTITKESPNYEVSGRGWSK